MRYATARSYFAIENQPLRNGQSSNPAARTGSLVRLGVLATAGVADDEPGGVHCETGIQEGPPRSLRMKVIEPLTVMEVVPSKLMFPPDPKTTDPPSG